MTAPTAAATPRRSPRHTALAAVLATALAAALSTGCASPPPAGDTAELAARLSGHFSSAAQASADSDYFAIELRVVPIWPQRSDGPWLYVEQADARSPERPYRQRVYRLEHQGERYWSHIYTFKGDPLHHAGAWRQAQPLATLTPADLEPRPGCAVQLERLADGSYRGATAERSCPSDLRGARWAGSEVWLDANALHSWDRGFDAQGQQVWGARKGAYRFLRIAPLPAQ